jgi:UDP-glucose 4-epimerase
MGRRVLITGVAGFWGTELARCLERSPEVEYIAGLDVRPPAADLARTEFIRADIRNPLISKLLPQTAVDTVVHCDVLLVPEPGKAREQLHDINVIGSLQLLGACERSPSVRTIVIRGSAGIYGSEPQAPQFFTEEMARLYPLRTRFQRDVGEIENYFETYSRRHPQVTCMMLRYQPAIGPSTDSQVTRYLRLPVVPTYLGFDPRLQFIHVSDGLEALVASIKNPLRGAVNVAAPGTIGVTKMIRLAGKASLPIASPLFPTVATFGRRLGAFSSLSPDFQRLLRYGRAVDTRRLVEEVGFRPRYDAVAAVEDYVRTQSGKRIVPGFRDLVGAS